MTTIPTHIEKILAKLRAQIKKAKIEGTYHVSSQGIVYSLGDQAQILTIGSLQRETDSQMLRRKLDTFLDDLQQSGTSSRQPEVPFGNTLEEKLLMYVNIAIPHVLDRLRNYHIIFSWEL
ncbi:hypothetical protein C2G38_2041648 [Gigaspora rosea]|uniref:Uncharacterized protein n=1 Tax=Gigaspora rosea TaxID=44941 RepID=A0A397UR09_9GLOM|nr:hypothetical protein C2G38_2041648 [Gigaspora rosea]